jgi:hypothetical protein
MEVVISSLTFPGANAIAGLVPSATANGPVRTGPGIHKLGRIVP